MRQSRRFTVSSIESLEERVVLSQGGLFGLGDVLARLQSHAAAKVSGPATIGAVGDSLTDPYQGYKSDRIHARNWVEQLAATRHASFGSYSRNVHFETGHPGYSMVWARSGATTSDVVKDQLPRLADQVAKGHAKYAAVVMGDNDFGQFLDQVPSLASDLPTLITKLAQAEKTAQTNFDTTVKTLLDANPNGKLVVGTIFDISATPAVKAKLASFGAQGQAIGVLISQAIGAYNEHLRATAAASDRIALADLATQSELLQSQGARTGTFSMGAVTVDMAHPGDGYRNFLLADGFHPGTLAQGIIANTLVDALNGKFNAGIRPLTSAEIVTIAKRVQAPSSSQIRR